MTKIETSLSICLRFFQIVTKIAKDIILSYLIDFKYLYLKWMDKWDFWRLKS